ncbi:phosphatidate cytidylyltransferase [Candidatus Pelagibacter sp.]|nr:phosphatidate cytidylyltransferase [Candidatus Pelagibacter sp.]
MNNNLFKRIITSLFLLSILLIANFSHHYIFISSVLTLGIIICYEANNIFSKLIISNISQHKTINKKLNFNLLLLNILTFCYIFFVFCYFSYEIHRLKTPIFFLYIISICFFTDIGGYVFGKIIGGKKLTKISPKKTISGTIGSFIFCIIPLILFFNQNYLDLELNFYNISFCFFVSLISQIGDLFISYLKRKAKIKDTGKILPGHGGVLDRVDGMIFAVPFSYFLLKLA